MIERNKYLNMCQRANCKMHTVKSKNCVKWDNGELVLYEGHLYIPTKLQIFFDREGLPHYSAIIEDTVINSVVVANLKDVYEGV